MHYQLSDNILLLGFDFTRALFAAAPNLLCKLPRSPRSLFLQVCFGFNELSTGNPSALQSFTVNGLTFEEAYAACTTKRVCFQKRIVTAFPLK